MKYLKEKMPILYSPTFWGLTFTAGFSVLGYYEVADEGLLTNCHIYWWNYRC